MTHLSQVWSDAGVVGLKGAGIQECSFVYASKKSVAFLVNGIHEIHKCSATQFSDLVLNFTQIRQELWTERM
jgi:hypothetical protein